MARGPHGERPRRERIESLLARWRKRGRRWDTRPYYPAILDIAGRTALVVGAGKVGEGKIEGLLNARRQACASSRSRPPTRCARWADGGTDRARAARVRERRPRRRASW